MNTALLVIDVQNIYTDSKSELYCSQSKKAIKNINDLIAHFSAKRLPIYFIRHIHKANGSDLGRMFDFTGEAEDDFNFKENTPEVEYDPRLQKQGNSFEIIKNRYSAFEGTRLHAMLKQSGTDTVVICGFMTNFCCDSTAREAHDKDYYVDFIWDATDTPGTDNLNNKDIQRYTKESLGAGIARIATAKRYIVTHSK